VVGSSRIIIPRRTEKYPSAHDTSKGTAGAAAIRLPNDARILAVRRLFHIASIVLITAGLVVLVDAGLTLVWQEPLSAAYGSFKQGQAADQLNELESQYPTPADLEAISNVRGSAAKARVLADRFESHLQEGHAIGRIKIDRIGLNIVVIQGTDTASLEKGPGHYRNTPIPGQPGTVAIAGHRTTYLAPFRHIDQIQDGDEIRVEMPYAAFTYTVQRHQIVDPSDVGIIKPVGYPQLVLTACHPPYSAAQRYAIFAKLTRIDTFAVTGEGRWPAP
jgi:sortase A